MATATGTIEFTTKKNDGIKMNGEWFNTPYGTTLPPSLAKGAAVTFSYDEQNRKGRIYKIIDLASVAGGGTPTVGNAGGYTAPSSKGSPQQLQIVRQSSLNRAVDYATELMRIQLGEAVANKVKKVEVAIITPTQIMQLADQFQQWVVGDLELPALGTGTGAEAPKTTEAAGAPAEDPSSEAPRPF